jgi:hypothetical protein
MTYHVSQVCITRKHSVECHFYLSAISIVCRITLQDLVEALEEERPEVVDGTVIVYLIKNMSYPMKVGLYLVGVDLNRGASFLTNQTQRQSEWLTIHRRK